MTQRSPLLFLTLLLCAFFIAPGVSLAKSAKNQAKDYCKSWEKSHPGQNCGYVRGLICTGKDWKKLKTFKALWTACRQVGGQNDNKKAKQRCKEHNKYWTSKHCQVHYPRCKAGWTKIQKYGKYYACRKLNPSGSLLYDGYQAFMKKWEGKAHKKMPRHIQIYVKKKFNFDPNKVRWGQVSNPHAGCTTDCYNIYCRSNKKIYEQFNAGRIWDDVVFHELAHVEQCRNKGSRKSYGLYWFKNLPVGFFKALKPGVKDKFKNKVHDRMPMEGSAESKAKKVMAHYKNKHYNVKWKCRLYRDNKIVWQTANGYYRTQCEDKSHKTYKDAMKKYQALRKSGGHFIMTFGNKSATHYKIFEKKIRKPRAPRRKNGAIKS